MTEKKVENLTLKETCERYTGLAYHIIDKACISTLNPNLVDDCRQEVYIAIIKAFNTFDPSKNLTFYIYVSYHIRFAIKAFLRENLYEVNGAFHRTIQKKYKDKDMSKYTMKDCEKLNMQPETLFVLQNMENYKTSHTVRLDGMDDEIDRMGVFHIDDQYSCDFLDWQSYLNEEETYVVSRHYGFDGNPTCMEAIGKEMGKSKASVRHILNKALDKLRAVPNISDWAYAY